MTSEAVEYARRANLIVAAKIRKRAYQDDGVLGPCLALYEQRLGEEPTKDEFLDDLTAPLLAGLPETKASIEARMARKWADDPDRIPMSVVNSLRRSAGTNYQGLVTFALASYLVAEESAWYVMNPVPPEFTQALAIRFELPAPAGLEAAEEPAVEAPTDVEAAVEFDLLAVDVADEEEEQLEDTFVVKPDVDILLRNAAWPADSEVAEPIVLLSVKTSLADRAGAAARWKMYFDLATNPCPHVADEACAYRRLGITMDNADKYEITQGLVTANIYKIQFHDERYHAGELESGQVQSNTYMFGLKLTTRNDGVAVTPPSWRQFPALIDELVALSSRYSLPA